MKTLLNWLDHRTGVKGLLHEALYERIPGGSRWRYVWGSTLVFTFSVQVITGIFLWTAYSPSSQTAWESVYYIQHVMTLGWLVRGLHHFSAQAMVVLLALHLMQVIIDGAYKAPREVNFWLGLILMQIVLGLGLTGYLLPWDQKGYYATKVSTEIMGATPVVGLQLQELAQGGPQYGHHTLTRFFAMHAGILPGLLIAFLGLHIYVFRRHGICSKEPYRAPTATFWPDQVLKDAVACLGVLAVVMLLTVFKGAELSAPADPSEAYAAARPEWYFLFLFRFLKFEAVEHIGIPFGAIYVPGTIMTIIALMPIIAWFKGGHKFNVAFIVLLMIGIGVLTGMAFYEDTHDPAFQAAVATAHRDAERTSVLASRPSGIPAAGAVSMLRSDPLSQGPRLFARKCAVCHSFNGHDGLGSPLAGKATAADLGKFGSPDWVRSVLLDFKGTFAAVGEEFTSGDMADWSETHKEVLSAAENKESLDALVAFIVAQGERTDLPAPDPQLVARGKEIFTGGMLAMGEISVCSDCHSMHAVGDETPIAEDGYAPSLTGYGSRKWLDSFIRNPAAEQHYGDNNTMTAFEQQLSPEEIDLIARWMSGDYYRPDESPDARKPSLANE